MQAGIRLATTAVFIAAFTSSVSAGPYSDSLGQCLVASSSTAEKTVLVRWMFAMMSLHPDVQARSSMSPEQRTELSKQTAGLFMRLLTESCASEARHAIRYEGPAAIQSSFSLLGQVAARELFENPAVAEGLSEFAKYIDEDKINQLSEPPKQ